MLLVAFWSMLTSMIWVILGITAVFAFALGWGFSAEHHRKVQWWRDRGLR